MCNTTLLDLHYGSKMLFKKEKKIHIMLLYTFLSHANLSQAFLSRVTSYTARRVISILSTYKGKQLLMILIYAKVDSAILGINMVVRTLYLC